MKVEEEEEECHEEGRWGRRRERKCVMETVFGVTEKVERGGGGGGRVSWRR